MKSITSRRKQTKPHTRILQAQKRIIQNEGKYLNQESFMASKTSRTDFKKAYLNQSGYNTNWTLLALNITPTCFGNSLWSESKKDCCKKGETKNKHLSWSTKTVPLRRELEHSWKTDLKTHSCNKARGNAFITSGLQFIFFYFYI